MRVRVRVRMLQRAIISTELSPLHFSFCSHYSEPQDHPPPPTTYSCDFLDFQFGVVAGLCEYAGVDLEADLEGLGCNCDGCMCSGWPPPDLQYLHKFALESGFAATEEVCFSRNTGSGKVAIQVTDDRWKHAVTTGSRGYH